MNRLLQPLLKINGQHCPISFDEAFRHIAEQYSHAPENRTLVISSGDYTNEELYMMQRLARTGLQTNALGSFDYYNRGTAFFIDKNDIVPFAELFGSDMFLCIFDEQTNAESQNIVRKIVDSCPKAQRYPFNTPSTLNIQNYGAFFRSLCHYLLHSNLAKGIYVNGLGKDFDTYKQKLLQEDYQELLGLNHLVPEDVESFIQMISKAEAPVFLVWERFLDERGIIELENLCMLLDIQAKPSTGFLSIKADLNSQGLFDMGMFPNVCVGGRPMDDSSIALMKDIYKHTVCTTPIDLTKQLEEEAFSHLFVFNSTNSPIPEPIRKQVRSCSFSVLQTAYSENADLDFDLILPASLPDEVYGTFTDSTRVPHNSKPAHDCPVSFNTIEQLSALGTQFGLEPLTNPTDIFLEYASFFQGGCRSKYRHFFR